MLSIEILLAMQYNLGIKGIDPVLSVKRNRDTSSAQELGHEPCRSYNIRIEGSKSTMSNLNLEPTIKELMELKRMREEIDTEIANIEDEIKQAMGSEETLIAGAFKVDWKTVITSRIDTTALKKALPEIAERFMKQTTTRRFCVR